MPKGWAAALLGLTLLAGWWPLNFLPANRLHWRGEGNGVVFEGQGCLYGAAPLDKLALPSNGSPPAITLAMRVTPATSSPNSLPCLVSFFWRPNDQVLLLGQWKTGLVIRHQPAYSHRRSEFREIGVGSVLVSNQPIQITLVSSVQAGTLVYTNGNLATRSPRYHLLRSENLATPEIIVGCSATGGAGWSGEMRWLALFNRALGSNEVRELRRIHEANPGTDEQLLPECVACYHFDHPHSDQITNQVAGGMPLIVPRHFRALESRLLLPLSLDFRIDPSYVQDMVVNVFGFCPAGFALAWMLGRRCRSASSANPLNTRIGMTLAAILAATGLSAIIEIGQGWLPGRSSQMMDVLMNAIGGALGAWLALGRGLRFLRWSDRPRQ